MPAWATRLTHERSSADMAAYQGSSDSIRADAAVARRAGGALEAAHRGGALTGGHDAQPRPSAAVAPPAIGGIRQGAMC